MSVNKVILLGRLGQTPELKYLPNGTAVAQLSLATTEKWTGKDGQKQERTEWHRVIAYGKQAENLQKYCDKGTELYVEGRLQTRSWDKNGEKRYVTEIILTEMSFIGGNKRKDQGSSDPGPGDEHAPGPESSDEGVDANFAADDIPF